MFSLPSDLSRRDDLESLGYTLLFFLRRDLPWRRHSNGQGTIAGEIAQVRAKKLAWPGSRLALGYPPEFGVFLDCARHLGLNEQPDYEGWRSKFRELSERSGYADDGLFDWATVASGTCELACIKID
jgi:casein kinase I family protein HRR25